LPVIHVTLSVNFAYIGTIIKRNIIIANFVGGKFPIDWPQAHPWKAPAISVNADCSSGCVRIN
jgi:hypothetical protein